jgi:hypothetical protein
VGRAARRGKGHGAGGAGRLAGMGAKFLAGRRARFVAAAFRQGRQNYDFTDFGNPASLGSAKVHLGAACLGWRGGRTRIMDIPQIPQHGGHCQGPQCGAKCRFSSLGIDPLTHHLTAPRAPGEAPSPQPRKAFRFHPLPFTLYPPPPIAHRQPLPLTLDPSSPPAISGYMSKPHQTPGARPITIEVIPSRGLDAIGKFEENRMRIDLPPVYELRGANLTN